MKKLFLLTITVVITFFSNLTVKAQEIEVNGDNPSSSYIRWINGQSQLALNNNYNELWFSSGSMPNFQGGIVSIVEAGLSVGFEVTQNNGATFRVYGDGTVEQNGIVIHSDSTLKTDIEPLGIHTEKLKQLKCYQYHLKADKKNNPKPTKRYGLLAQELEKVYPDMVFTNEKNLKSINYMELIPVLIEVVKEQQAQLEAKDKQYEDLVKRIEKLERK